MVQLSENGEMQGTIQPLHPPPVSMTQSVQLTGDTITTTLPHRRAVDTQDHQLATNSSHRKHEGLDNMESWNGYSDDRAPQSLGIPNTDVLRVRAETDPNRIPSSSYHGHDYHQQHLKKRTCGTSPLDQKPPVPCDRWSSYGDSRNRSDRIFHRSPPDRQEPRIDRREPRDDRWNVRGDWKERSSDGDLGRERQREQERYRHDDRDQDIDTSRDRGKFQSHGDKGRYSLREDSAVVGRQRDVYREHYHRRDRGQEHVRDGDQESEVRQDRDAERKFAHAQFMKKERDRDLGRGYNREPRRREPVGEETGYDSDHSRVSRSTTVSHSTKSLPRRPRADSAASHTSVASSRLLPTSKGRTTRGTGSGYQEAYGSREMYDQYQYYYHYYRDHPYYKEYYRQWMKQYGQAYPSESFYDDRTSIHSGRSSVNDELKKSVSSGELSGVPSVADDTTSEAPQRMTPVQFGRPHINAQFTFGGQLALVLPKDPRDGEKALVQLRDVQKMLCMDPGMNRTIQQMKNYPGPLTLSDTHKDVVVKYCEQQVAEAARNLSLPDKESVMLTWEYLALLVKQNGKLYGSDVAGLLLKGREVTAQPQHNNTHVQPENLAPENLASEAGPQDEGTDVQSQAVISTPERDEALLVKKFTEYLCLGRKREAVDYAVQEGLWGHALALSYKMDTTTHTRVLAAFSSSIPSTDVLLTLFQQLSGKRPEITKTYTPLQWGDWRQHLAVMISNPTGHTQRDRASIVTLGDTLATQGQLYAAHFCYLMAEVEWGSYSSKDSKLVLIGASHQLPFQAFATNEAIQCTEVYEFARSLDSSNPLLETFQPYKLVYALRLTEYGFPTEALRYCEVISQLVSKTPASHQTDFLSQVYDLASRLKYHDLHYQMCQGEVSEMPDPQWLTNLKSVINLSKAHISQTATEQDNPQTLQDHQVVQDSGLQLADTTDHNQQVPYSSSGVYPSSFTNSDKSYHHNIDNTSGNSYSQEQDIGRDAFVGQAPPANAVDGVHQNMYASNHLLDSQSPVERVDAQLPSEAGQPSDMVNPSKENASLGEVSMMQPPPQDQMQYMYSGGYLSGYPEQEPIASLYMQRSSLEVTHGSLPPSSDVSGEQRPGSVTLSQPSSLSNYQSYQTWEQHQQVNTDAPGHMPPTSPEPTESELSAHSQRTPEEEAYWAEMSGKKSMNSATDTSSKDKSVEGKVMDKDLDKSQDKSGGWSITSLFGWKKSKQAVLPDDKNPTIIWDEEKKKWVNQDGDEEVTSPPPPPPKSVLGGPGTSPHMMTRGGPRKSRYVNTEKDAQGMAGGMPSNLPNPMLLPVPGAPMNINSPSASQPLMVPAPLPPPKEDRDATGSIPQPPHNVGYQEHHQLPLPQTSPGPAPLPEIVQGTLSEGTEGNGSVPMMGQPIGQPQFFNPTQFKTSTNANPSQTRRPGPGRRSLPARR